MKNSNTVKNDIEQDVENQIATSEFSYNLFGLWTISDMAVERASPARSQEMKPIQLARKLRVYLFKIFPIENTWNEGREEMDGLYLMLIQSHCQYDHSEGGFERERMLLGDGALRGVTQSVVISLQSLNTAKQRRHLT